MTTYPTDRKKIEVWYRMTFDKHVHMQTMCLASKPSVKKMDTFQFRENLAERITV